MFGVRVFFLIAITPLLIPLSWAEVNVSGRVLDENNAAVGGARVTFRIATVEAAQSLTAPNGRFELRLPGDGDYLVNVRSPGACRARPG